MQRGFVSKVSFTGVIFTLVALVVVLIGLGLYWREDPGQKPYLAVLGGGFIFDYRIAEAFYGVSLNVEKPLRVSSIIEAQFEDPAGGPPFVEQVRVNARTTRYSLRSPGVHGVKKGQPYHVVLSLYDYSGKNLIERQTREFKSSQNSSILPEKPLTIGPGYHLNPDNPSSK